MPVRETIDVGTPVLTKPNLQSSPVSAANGSNSGKREFSPVSESTSPPVWKICVYFSRGYCKHGSSCRFNHSHGANTPPHQGSPVQLTPPAPLTPAEDSPEKQTPKYAIGRSDGEWLAQLQSELEELIGSQGSPVSVASLPHLFSAKYGKSLHAEGPTLEGPRNGRSIPSLLRLLTKLKGTVTVSDRSDGQKVVSLKRSTLPQKTVEQDNSSAFDSPSSRQIYLTFPAESTFSESDVALHFGAFGTVHDVRIPYQQKRMFGFVTFSSPSSVRGVLKQGNPHYICGSRVLVKPYRERTKALERPKYGEPSRLTSSESSIPQRGLFDSKLPPRHLAARSEGKSVFVPRGASSHNVQNWSKSQESPSTPQLLLSPPPHLEEVEATKDEQPVLREHEQETGADDAKEDVEVIAQKENLIIFEENTKTEQDVQESFEDSPLPCVKLFHDLDLVEATLVPLEALDGTAKEEAATTLDDWELDLGSILPDSPFSSPKRTQETKVPSPIEGTQVYSNQEWHASSPPSNYQPPMQPWAYQNTVTYAPPMNESWVPPAYAHSKSPHTAMTPMGELTQGMALMSMAHMGPCFAGPGIVPNGKGILFTGVRAFCTTCRQQQVAVPNSQCACCQQLLCQNMPHMNHLGQQVPPSWQMPVTAYVRTSPQ